MIYIFLDKKGSHSITTQTLVFTTTTSNVIIIIMCIFVNNEYEKLPSSRQIFPSIE